MKKLFRTMAVACLSAALLVPFAAVADEAPEDYAVDAGKTGGDPPTIPHRVKEGQTGKSCLACHEKGIKNAPPTSHPERLDCVQCHVPGEVAAEPTKKQTKGKK